MGLATLGHALTYPVTTAVAEGSFRLSKDFLTPDQRSMSHSLQIGHLLAGVPTLGTVDTGNNLPFFSFVLHFFCPTCALQFTGLILRKSPRNLGVVVGEAHLRKAFLERSS